jgi:regulator of replication initiation timing
MEDRFNRIEDKLDGVSKEISEVNVHIAEIKKDLRYHIKRTDLLELEVKPIKKHVVMVSGSFARYFCFDGAFE